MSNKILVAGATGQIGSYLVEILKEKGADLAAGVTSPEKSIVGIPSVVLDYGHPESMAEAMQRFDSLFLVAPFTPQMQAWSENAVRAAKEAGIKYVVRSSGAGADPDSEFLLGSIQGQIDEFVKQSGLAYTIVRPMTFMQNFATIHLQSIREQNAIYQPQGDGKSSFVHVKDVAAVSAEALTNSEAHQGKTYDVTGSQALSNGDVAAVISQATGTQISYIDVPEGQAEQSMRDVGMPQALIDQLMSLNRATKAGYTSAISPAVKEITGRDPITFAEFVRDNVEIWR